MEDVLNVLKIHNMACESCVIWGYVEVDVQTQICRDINARGQPYHTHHECWWTAASSLIYYTDYNHA